MSDNGTDNATGDSAPGRPRRGLVGRLIGGRYRVTNLQSAGASTLIADGHDTELDRSITLKIVRPELAEDPEFRGRFAVAMRAVSPLSHPNIAAIYAWGEERIGRRDTVYIVSEHLTGGSLRDLFDRGRWLTPSQALMVGLEACRGLDQAHRAGLVHTELTPAKLVFGDDGRLRIVDFGLARLLGERDWKTPARVATHVARYCSPEQALSQPVTDKTDVYSLALILAEAVTGKVPFAGGSTVATLSARIGRLMPFSADLGTLASVLERAGRPEPSDRYAAAELGRALVRTASKLPRPAPIPIVVASPFKHDPNRLRRPNDPTGGIRRPDDSAPRGVLVPPGSRRPARGPGSDGHLTAPTPGTPTGAATASPAPTTPVRPAPAAAGRPVIAPPGTVAAGQGTPTIDATPSPVEGRDESDSRATTEELARLASAPAPTDLPLASGPQSREDVLRQAPSSSPTVLPVVGSTAPVPGSLVPAGRKDRKRARKQAKRDAKRNAQQAVVDATRRKKAGSPPPTTPPPSTSGAPAAAPTAATGAPAGVSPATPAGPAVSKTVGAVASKTVPPVASTTGDPAVSKTVDPTLSKRKQRRAAKANRRATAGGRRHRWWVWILLMLGWLVLLGALGFLAYLAYTLFRTPTHEVPNLAGLTAQEANAQVDAFDWEVELTKGRSDVEPDPGEIIETFPEPGEKLAEGEPFQIVISEGPEFRTLPAFAGRPEVEVATQIAELRLAVGTTTENYDEEVPAGSVVSWSVPSQPGIGVGGEVLPGTEIDLVVSRGPAPRAVPDLQGQSVEQATVALTGIQLQIQVGEPVFSGTVAPGGIAAQDPAPGTEVPRGSTITVVPSKGPDLVQLPDLSGQNLQQITQTLADAGLRVGNIVLGSSSGTFVDAEVDGQSLDAGAPLLRDTPVDLVLF